MFKSNGDLFCNYWDNLFALRDVVKKVFVTAVIAKEPIAKFKKNKIKTANKMTVREFIIIQF